jgi:H+/gluconate symporter-like permease
MNDSSIMAQVYVVVAAGSVIGFIIRDLGGAEIAGWIIQVRFLDCCKQESGC